MGSDAIPLPDADLSGYVGIETTCDACGVRFEAIRPVFIDAERNLEYAALAASGGLTGLPCPRCRTVKQFTPPMLWIRRSASPHLFFCTERFLASENDHNALLLASNLRGRLGRLPATWTAEKIQTIEYRFLPYLLERFAKPGSHEWVAATQWQLILAAQVPRGDFASLGQLADLYLELLWAPADKVLGRMIDAAAARGDREAESRLAGTRQMLAILRRVNGMNIQPFATDGD